MEEKPRLAGADLPFLIALLTFSIPLLQGVVQTLWGDTAEYASLAW